MRWLLLGGAALVVVLVVVVLFVTTRDDGPPAIASGPGVFRVHPQYQRDGGQRAPEEVSYRGTTFKVGFGGASGSGDRLRAALVVIGPNGTLKPTADYRTGAVIELDGAALKVRAIHAGKSDLDDLVDVQVVPPDQ